ncbi:hypothetical protein BGZ46_006554 [Entomortierella lignicola]|nr:hypothetical protein BGZ46_006554 [Entomortierella lignicola]
MPNPLLIPEILNVVFEALDTPSLIVSSTVCRSWHSFAIQALWRDIRRLEPDPRFYLIVQKYGHHARRLDVILDSHSQFSSPSTASAVTTLQLDSTLQGMPLLRHLALEFSHGWFSQTILPIFDVIKANVAANLESLRITMNTPSGDDQPPYTISAEDAKGFFPALEQLTELYLDVIPADETMSVILGSLPLLSKVEFRNVPDLEFDHFGDRSLELMGQRLDSLSDLTINFNYRITSTGLIKFSTFCKTLTRLNLSHCPQLISEAFETLVEASPLLIDITLSSTRITDSLLVKLAVPARATNLQVLVVEKCLLITTAGILSIVKSCSSLKSLDFSGCSAVTMEVFKDSIWSCVQLESLKFGGIHCNHQAMIWKVSHLDIIDMYNQLGQLPNINYLDMSALPFGLELFGRGRVAIESMRRLRKLVLRDRKDNMKDREAIWLATCLPNLRTLQINPSRVRQELITELLAVNVLLNVEFFQFRSRIRSVSEDSEDSDGSNPSSSDDFNESVGSGGYGTFSVGGHDSYDDSEMLHTSYNSDPSNDIDNSNESDESQDSDDPHSFFFNSDISDNSNLPQDSEDFEDSDGQNQDYSNQDGVSESDASDEMKHLSEIEKTSEQEDDTSEDEENISGNLTESEEDNDSDVSENSGDVSVSEDDNDTSNSGEDISEDDSSKSEDDSSEPEDGSSKPEDDSSEPEGDSSEPEGDSSEPEDDSSEPESDSSKSEDNSSESEDSSTKSKYSSFESEDDREVSENEEDSDGSS